LPNALTFEADQPEHTAACHITVALDPGVPLRNVQEAASYADPRERPCTTAAPALDRRVTNIVVAYFAAQPAES
jgi:hypothetical protein